MKSKNAVAGVKVVHKEFGYKGVIVGVTKDPICEKLLVVSWDSFSGVYCYYASDLKKAEKVK